MGSTNYGTQTITLAYANAGTAESVNTWLTPGLKGGIYSGGSISVEAGNVARLDTHTAYFRCTTGQMVKVITSAVIDITLTEAAPYVTGLFAWLNNATNYADYYARAYGSISANEIIFGKGIFVGGVLTSIDYSMRTDVRTPYSGDVVTCSTLGQEVQKLETQNAELSRPNEIKVQGYVATTDATETALTTITLDADSTIALESRITARCYSDVATVSGATGDSAFYIQRGLFKRVGSASVVQVGSTQDETVIEDYATWSTRLNPTGNTVQVLVTGAVDNKIHWHESATIHKLKIV